MRPTHRSSKRIKTAVLGAAAAAILGTTACTPAQRNEVQNVSNGSGNSSSNSSNNSSSNN